VCAHVSLWGWLSVVAVFCAAAVAWLHRLCILHFINGVLQISAERNPQQFGRLLAYYDELYIAVHFLLENYYLTHYGTCTRTHCFWPPLLPEVTLDMVGTWCLQAGCPSSSVKTLQWSQSSHSVKECHLFLLHQLTPDGSEAVSFMPVPSFKAASQQ